MHGGFKALFFGCAKSWREGLSRKGAKDAKKCTGDLRRYFWLRQQGEEGGVSRKAAKAQKIQNTWIQGATPLKSVGTDYG